jgi:hypothetical protein
VIFADIGKFLNLFFLGWRYIRSKVEQVITKIF